MLGPSPSNPKSFGLSHFAKSESKMCSLIPKKGRAPALVSQAAPEKRELSACGPRVLSVGRTGHGSGEEGACTASTPNWQVQVTRLTRGSLILLSVLGRLTNNGHHMEVTLSQGLSN